MKVLYIFFLKLVFLSIYSSSSDYHKKNDDSNLFSIIKNKIYGKIEEYQQNYEHFKNLMKILKFHFYDNYNHDNKNKFRLVKRETQKSRKLNVNTTNNTISPFLTPNCSNIGKYINTTETYFYCNNTKVLPDEFNILSKNSSNCIKKESQLELCYCPKDYNGIQCENKIKTICKFGNLYVNGQDLYKNYNTFYDEYLNNIFSSDFDKNMNLQYNLTLRCVTPNANNETYYYTNKYSIVNLTNITIPKFSYFQDSRNITISLQPNLSFIYRLYDMRSLLPKIEIFLPLNNNIFKGCILQDLNNNFTISYQIFQNYSNIDPMSLLVAGRLFYEIDLLDSTNDTISFMHFHSALDVISDFEIVKSRNFKNIIIVVLLVGVAIILSILLIFIYFRKKKNNEKISQIEINSLAKSKNQ